MKQNIPLGIPAVAGIVREQGFAQSEEETRALTEYLELLMKWNKAMNLVGPYGWEAALRILIMDSLHLARFLEGLQLPHAPRCWDLGAGAGLPGIPLRIVWKAGEYHLVEVREKRTLFMQQVVTRLKLADTHVFRGRAEDFMRDRQPADVILSRAFMPWEKLLDFVRPHVDPQGRVVVLALESAPASLPAGWSAEVQQEYAVGRDRRYFWSLRPSSVPI
ncbi:16S rRNA (guanine(527)-N(7))-methyltransferase RsmG [Desulfovibrio psychrotolerans]|uniref:Ribosomal RNA small subunit methyltransferase G n=1 Tax=Desulfovibrio psychrotolerans TaxID=415242 RepID=A0A7J0BUQ3_9BACT|nr:16S rRNA (guanine(527)-N(7))-methyltransferase RsmG [Desulfovibrio psychrotolerans]GFM37439.1 ribosomal RNA small subunit methyltransferase G [Desulfovibrio psychrotolerans]